MFSPGHTLPIYFLLNKIVGSFNQNGIDGVNSVVGVIGVDGIDGICSIIYIFLIIFYYFYSFHSGFVHRLFLFNKMK
jgi:hypothetical protein